MQTNTRIKDFSAEFYGPDKGSIVTVVLSTTIAGLDSEVKVQVAYPGVSLDIRQKPTMNAQRTVVALNFKYATQTEYPCLLSCVGDSVALIRNINKTIASQLSRRGIEVYDERMYVQRIVDDRVYLTVQKFHLHQIREATRQLTVIARIIRTDLTVESFHPQ